MISRHQAEGWQLDGNSAEAYEEYFGAAFQPFAAGLVRLAEVSAGDRVLDVGCGTGVVAREAAAAAGETGRVVGLDVNAEMLRVATAVSAGIRPRIEWRQGNATSLPFTDAAFDVVTCEQALAFFSDPVAALAEMRRVLDKRWPRRRERVPSASSTARPTPSWLTHSTGTSARRLAR